MRINDALQLAKDLMKEHNVREDCGLALSRGKRTLGYVEWTAPFHIPVISLSAHLIPMISDEEVKHTILHEIAHVLSGPGQGHNWLWKRNCIKIGCSTSRLIPLKSVIEGRYTLKCECGNVWNRYRAGSKMKTRYYICGKCGKDDLVWVDNHTGRQIYQPSFSSCFS